MQTVEEFLAHAVRIEQDAADRFGQLADAMKTAGNTEVSRLFRQFADYSRMHLADARSRAGYREIPDLAHDDYQWPDIESPETAAIWAADPQLGRGQALEIALEAEASSLAYYQSIAVATTDPEVRRFAKEFAVEEEEHVRELTRWLELHRKGEALPVI
ncbi:ferritin-like domain-containing protein [Derxia gummosa]|uniref:Ferritin-like domain-containing protein n=1 Tax=Derxia gummosa DSM 723 TaxID=1121388 RepID=A0A8B6X1Y3_9BURK|nr:ferritin family protein [Derxia gummosa]